MKPEPLIAVRYMYARYMYAMQEALFMPDQFTVPRSLAASVVRTCTPLHHCVHYIIVCLYNSIWRATNV